MSALEDTWRKSSYSGNAGPVSRLPSPGTSRPTRSGCPTVSRWPSPPPRSWCVTPRTVTSATWTSLRPSGWRSSPTSKTNDCSRTVERPSGCGSADAWPVRPASAGRPGSLADASGLGGIVRWRGSGRGALRKVDIGGVDLSHLRVTKTGEHDLSLASEGEHELHGFADTPGAGTDEPETVLLTAHIAAFNERFGQGLSDADRLMVEERLAAVMDHPDVQLAAVANSDEEAFAHVFNPVMEDAMLERAEANSKFTDRYFGDDEFRSSLDNSMRRAAFRLLRRQHGVTDR